MRLPAQNRITPPPLHTTLARLRSTLQLDSHAWSEMLGLQETESLQVEQGHRSLDILQLAELSSRLNLSLDLFASGEIDWGAVAHDFFGGKAKCPEKYANAAFSKRRTSLAMLDYLETFYGWNWRQAVLRRHQVTEALFQDPDAKINLRFLKDACAHLRSLGFSEKELEAMGAYALLVNYHGPVASQMRQAETPARSFELFINHLVPHYFDRNNEYRLLQLDEHSAILEIRASAELLSELPLAQISSPELCAYRRGVTASSIGYLDLPYAEITETACIHKGDSCCRYLVDYSKAAALQLKPQSPGPRILQS